MRRGEIWWAAFDERRPVVLLSEYEPSGFRAMQVVAPADTDISGSGYRPAGSSPPPLLLPEPYTPVSSTALTPVPFTSPRLEPGTKPPSPGGN